MLFEELVEQHHIHRVVADGVDLALLIAHHQVRVRFGYLLGNQTKLRRASAIALVMKRHRLERQDGFACLFHRPGVFLEAARGTGSAKLTGRAYQHWYGNGGRRCHPINTADEGSSLYRPDANSAGLATSTSVADIDVETTRGEHVTGEYAQGDVGGAGVVKKCVRTDGCVVVAACVAKERFIAGGGVVPAGCVGTGRTDSGGGV